MAGGGGGEVVVELRRLISEALGRIREEAGLASMWWLVEVEVWQNLFGHSLGISMSLMANVRGWRVLNAAVAIEPDMVGRIDVTVVLGNAFNEILNRFHREFRERDAVVGVVS
jgi:hypothetical protein